jgi:hypothetical protein
MDDHVDVTIPVERDIARPPESPTRREAAGHVPSNSLKGVHLRDVLGEVIADAKREARDNGLNDEDIDAELQAWRTAPHS